MGWAVGVQLGASTTHLDSVVLLVVILLLEGSGSFLQWQRRKRCCISNSLCVCAHLSDTNIISRCQLCSRLFSCALASFLQRQRRQRCFVSNSVCTSPTRSFSHIANCTPILHLARSYERRALADRSTHAFRHICLSVNQGRVFGRYEFGTL